MPLVSKKSIEELKSIPIDTLAETLGYHLKSNGKGFDLNECPACSQHNAKIVPQGNYFKCFSGKHGACEVGGDPISFYGYHHDKNFTESAEGLADLMGITIEYENGKVKKSNRKPVRYKKVEVQKVAPAADPDTLDKVYRAFLSLCPITKPHAEEWFSTRGYTKKEIKTLLLRSVPDLGRTGQILSILKKKGYPLERIPGFTQKFIAYKGDYPPELLTEDKEKGGYWFWTISVTSGYFIPVHDENGRIKGLKIRLEKPFNGNKYIWFSSAENLTHEYKSKWKKGGAASGAPLNIVPPIELIPLWKGNALDDICDISTVVATEGEHKSIISANKINKVVIGVPGVGQYKDLPPLLQKWGTKKLIIAYDMDSLKSDNGNGKNQQVFDHLTEFAKKALQLGIEVCVWTWDPKHGKGLDDLLLNNRLPMEINLRTKERKMVDKNMIA